MDAVANPYSPGAGRTPPALVGRERPLEMWSTGVSRVMRGRTAQPVVLYGLRGVGKTVLLGEYRRRAAAEAWIVAQVEAGVGRSLRELLGEALHGPLTDLVRPSAGRRLLRLLRTALSFKASYDSNGTWNFGVDLTEVGGGGADTGVLETDLAKLFNDLSAAASEESIGVAVLIDEAQDLTREELTALCAVAHVAGQQDWPLLIALAGLPSLPRVLAEAKSYAERLFAYERIEHLDRSGAVSAIVDPAQAEGVEWTTEAVDHVVSEAMGYPYFLQQFGQESWREAARSPIDLSDARVGAARGHGVLDSGFFRARWDRATPAEQNYLRAMAVDGDAGSQSGEVAARLGRAVTSLGPTRANLIAKGLVYAPAHGIVAFTVPGMADFVHRQPTG